MVTWSGLYRRQKYLSRAGRPLCHSWIWERRGHLLHKIIWHKSPSAPFYKKLIESGTRGVAHVQKGEKIPVKGQGTPRNGQLNELFWSCRGRGGGSVALREAFACAIYVRCAWLRRDVWRCTVKLTLTLGNKALKNSLDRIHNFLLNIFHFLDVINNWLMYRFRLPSWKFPKSGLETLAQASIRVNVRLRLEDQVWFEPHTWKEYLRTWT